MTKQIDMRLVAVAVVAIMLGGAYAATMLIIPPRDINSYGTVTVHSLYGSDGGLSPALADGDTIAAEDMLLVVWYPDPNYSGELTCQLYSTAGVWYEDGGWTFTTYQDVYRHQWVFELATVPQETTEFYCAFGGMYTEEISWVGSTIHFNIYSTVPPEDTVVEFTEEPDDTSGAGGELVALRWSFVCEGAAAGTITVDGSAEAPRTITSSSSPQAFTYSFQEDVAGTYIVVLTITPEYGDAVSSSCEVVVTSTTTYDDAVITVEPTDKDFSFDESPAHVTWTFSYDGPCTADVRLADGTEVDSQTYIASTNDKMFDYIVDTSVAGTYELILTVTPDDYNNVPVVDSVTVTVEASTTTTTTTTTTTPPSDEEMFNTLLFFGMVGVAVIAIAVVCLRRKR